jgi:hypothetical protein
MSNELFTSNLSSGVCENLILLIIVLERLFWPIVFFAFIGLSISPPVDEVDVNKLVIKCENDMYPEYDEVVSVSESDEDDDDDSEYVEETEDGTTDNESEDDITDNESEDDESDSGWADEDEEDDVNDSDYVEETEEDESDSGDSGYEEESDEEEVLYVVPNVQIYRPNYCLRSSDLLTI